MIDSATEPLDNVNRAYARTADILANNALWKESNKHIFAFTNPTTETLLANEEETVDMSANGKVKIGDSEYEFQIHLKEVKSLDKTKNPVQIQPDMTVQPEASPSYFMKVPEVAQLLGISPSQVYVLLDSGEIPGQVKFGKSKRVKSDVLHAWINNHDK